MVDLGARLTGADPHERFCTWVEHELSAAGLELLVPDEYAYVRWHAERVDLELSVEGRPVHVDVAFAYVRSASTDPGGATGTLIHLGAMPLAASGGLGSNGQLTPAALESWLGGRDRKLLAGAIVVVELPVPTRLTAQGFVAIADYLHWPGHGTEDWIALDYTRPWIGPWPELGLFAELGVGAWSSSPTHRTRCLPGTTRPTSAAASRCPQWWSGERAARSCERCRGQRRRLARASRCTRRALRCDSVR